MTNNGLYVIFEGTDGAGKSTTMKSVAAILQKHINKPIHLTSHPGATPLGAHIRQLVKYPETIDKNIEIDNLSRQILYMVDTVSFVKQKLEPALHANEVVFADRSSFISALVYGTAEGLSLSDIDRLFQLIVPPKANRLYILYSPLEVWQARIERRGDKDYFERKPMAFFQKITEIYDSLITGPAERTLLVSKSVNLDNIVYIDSTQPLYKIVEFIVKDLLQEMQGLGIVTTNNSPD